MEVLTLYVGQGNFAVVRHGTQAIAVDTRWLAEQSEEIESRVGRFLRRRELVGIVLTGFDDDHADPAGLDWLLENYAPDWVMYPRYCRSAGCGLARWWRISRVCRRPECSCVWVTRWSRSTRKWIGLRPSGTS